ncbi:MAG: peptidoglycan-binding protein [Alphaproteobacteria bacterium]|nr:peptidoglycan-binding protein [Alphaproteobacteria bacterium]
MNTNFARGAVLTGAITAAIALVPSSAFALPDLVINTADSYVQPGGCSKEQPIATGRIAIKNQGTDVADVNVAERLTRSMLVVYVPENIDLIDKRPERSKLQPLDQQGIEFNLGEGKLKRGRNFAAPLATVSSTLNSSSVDAGDRDRIRSIQNALLELGFDPKGVDGVIGSNTRAAIRDFQASLGDSRTGTLSPAQEQELFKKTGTTTVSTTGAQGETKVLIYVAVDPYNLVEETNEANNLWAVEVTIDCGN